MQRCVQTHIHTYKVEMERGNSHCTCSKRDINIRSLESSLQIYFLVLLQFSFWKVHKQNLNLHQSPCRSPWWILKFVTILIPTFQLCWKCCSHHCDKVRKRFCLCLKAAYKSNTFLISKTASKAKGKKHDVSYSLSH